MKPLRLLLLLLALTSPVWADMSYTFTPNPSNLNELNHLNWYLWKFSWKPVNNEIITGATLTFSNINNWANETNNRLQVHLLNNPGTTGWTSIGTRTENGFLQRTYQRSDNDNSKDNFASLSSSSQKLLGIYSDRDGHYGDMAPYSTVTFDFAHPANIPGTLTPAPSTLNLVDVLADWAVDGNWGIGIDPDCHFYNSGVTLTITTRAVPAPGAAILGMIGLGSVWYVRRRQAAV